MKSLPEIKSDNAKAVRRLSGIECETNNGVSFTRADPAVTGSCMTCKGEGVFVNVFKNGKVEVRLCDNCLKPITDRAKREVKRSIRAALEADQ